MRFAGPGAFLVCLRILLLDHVVNDSRKARGFTGSTIIFSHTSLQATRVPTICLSLGIARVFKTGVTESHPDPSPPAAGRWMGLSALWKNRELLWQFTIRTIHMKHKGSFLGILWIVLGPLLQLALYTIVFGLIFGGRFGRMEWETETDHAIGIFLGLTIFHVLAETMGVAPTAITTNPNFVKRVVFPLEILPVALVGASVFHFIISLLLVLIGVAVLGSSLTVTAFWLPLIVLPVIPLALGLAWLLSALGVFLRDLMQAVPFLTTAVMFGSAIFYPVSKVPEPIWAFLRYNPLVYTVTMSRDVLLWGLPFRPLPLLYTYVFSIVFCLFGYFVFQKLRPTFADVL